MKPLSKEQIKRAKEPNQLGKPKVTSSENYQNIYNRAHDSFGIIKQVAKILPDLENHSKRFGYASSTVELFSDENFEPILSSMFPTREDEGGPIDNKTHFEKSKINTQKAMFASKLLKFSSDYLLQAFPEQEYPNLHNRINELVKDLKGMTESFNRNQELQKQLKHLEDHVQYYEPLLMVPNPTQWNAGCNYCNALGTDKTEEEAIKKIQHAVKCKVPKEGDEDWTYKAEKWYKTQPPSKLVITWDQRKLLDELKIKTKKK